MRPLPKFLHLRPQMVLQSSRTLADLAEQTVVPAGYLYTLILLFMFIVRLDPPSSLRPKKLTAPRCTHAPLLIISTVLQGLAPR